MYNYKNIVPSILLLIGASIVYRKYKDRVEKYDDDMNNKLIRKYLLNENIPDKIKKPIIWIHIPYHINSRIWQDFGSRNTQNLNEPYLYITLRSIIENCSNSFKICLIDDNSFNYLLPNLNFDFSKLPEPIDHNVRLLAKLKLLEHYGGMFIPASFVCCKNLKNMYNDAMYNSSMFCNENISRNSTSSLVTSFCDDNIIGAKRNSPVLQECIQYIQNIISKDATQESKFEGKFSRFLFELSKNKKINIISGSKIGVKDDNDNPIIIDDIMQDTPLSLSHNNYGLYVPHDELLSRRKYNYFVYLSIPEILEGSTFLSKFINSQNINM